MVSKDFEYVNQEFHFVYLKKGPHEKSQRGKSSSSSEQNSKTDSLDGLQPRLQEKRISKADSNFISQLKSPNPNANYQLAWREWVTWCSRKETYSFSSNLNKILDYFTGLCKQGLQYKTINNYRFAVYDFHEQEQGNPIDEHPRMCALLTGIFNKRSLKSKYCFIWNVQTEGIRKEIKSFLIALHFKINCANGSYISLLCVRLVTPKHKFMAKTHSSYTFIFLKSHNAWTKGKSPSAVF